MQKGQTMGGQSMQKVQTMGQRVQTMGMKHAKSANDGGKRGQSVQKVQMMGAKGGKVCKGCK